jgi:hypothetical protein
MKSEEAKGAVPVRQRRMHRHGIAIGMPLQSQRLGTRQTETPSRILFF